MQPGSPPPGQDPFQPNPYQDYPSSPYRDEYGQASSSPYPTDPLTPSPAQPVEYTLYPDVQQPPPPPPPPPIPPPYPMGGYSVPVMQPMAVVGQNNTFGLLSMIFGIVSIPLLCCLYAGLPVGIAAVVLGVLGVGKANRGEANNKSMAIAGIVCGSIGALLGLVWIIGVFALNFSTPRY
jgi:hypothetical protein